MGSLGCPLCCQQDFKSVGTLRDHLIYCIYRPLQCGVCCLHLAGIQEFTHHLKCHMADELPRAAKLSCSKPSPPAGGESDSQLSPLLLPIAAQDGAGTDSDAGVGAAHLSDDYSSYMKGSDAANQLLKLREWRLEKLGKNFSRHRASFGKSPGLLELSPASGRLHRSSPPASVRDSAHDRRPPSQNSSYTAHSDVLSLNKDIDSVERSDSSATPMSVYGNIGSVELSQHNVCLQSVGKEVAGEPDFHSPAPFSAPYEAHFHPSEKTTSHGMKQMDLSPSLVEGVPNPSTVSDGEILPKNLNFQNYDLPESNVPCDVDMNQPPGGAVSPLYVPASQDVPSCSFQSPRNEFETLQDYDMCETDNIPEPLSKTCGTDNDINVEEYESNRLPLLETVNPSELSGDASPQYHELQPASHNRDQRFSETVSAIPDVWVSCPSSGSTALHKPLGAVNKPQSEINKDNYMAVDSHFSGIQYNLTNKSNMFSYLSPDKNGQNFHPEMNTGDKEVKNVNSDDTNLLKDGALKGTKSHTHLGSSSALPCPAHEAQTALEGGCEEPYLLVDTKPYLHKKFHHDQERKVLPSTGVDQVADVSQYINSFQSVLVRKLNGTLSTNIPMTSSICSPPMTKPEKDLSQVSLEEPHQPQAEEHVCKMCHKIFRTIAMFQLHCKEHEKGEDLCIENLYRKCSNDPSKKKEKRKDKKLQCDQCSKVFPKASSVSRHKREVHAVKKSFTCVQCSRAFSSKRHLQEHSEIHKGEKVHKCPKCQHTCYTTSGLRTHIQEVHSMNSGQRVHCCEICGEKFTKIYGLKRHTQRKHAGQQLECDICSKSFTCKEDLSKHRKTHLDGSAVKCDTCDQTFTTSWALQRHSKRHQSSPRNFKCHICNLAFTRKDSLVSHLHAHSQRKHFVCHCGKRFVKKSQLDEHQDKHSTVPKYTCQVCKHSFKFKVSLKNHSCKKRTVQTK